MINVGVDLHKTQFTVCIRQDENEVLQKEYRTGKEGYKAFLQDLKTYSLSKKEIRLAVETTGNVWHFVHVMEPCVGEIKVVNTMKFKVITQSTSKTDNRDAKTIAYYLWKDMLPTVTLPDAESRKISKVVKIRCQMVRRMTSLKNEIHALYMEEGIQIKRSQLTSAKQLEALKKMKADDHVVFLATILIDELIRLMVSTSVLERKLEEMTILDESVETLRTIPGTGIVNASAVRGIVANIERFDSPEKLSSYAGLVPWVSNSNEKVRHGHITKRGSVVLRNAFVQMAMGMIRTWAKRGGDNQLYSWYHKLVERIGGGKSKIALARRLSRIVWAMLHTKTSFSYALV
jgi:transposase